MPDATRSLVTGCGGFLGAEIVRQLLRRGDRVVGISRGSYPELVELGMTHVRGDLTCRDFVLDQVRDVDAVIHTAALAGVWGDWSRYFQTNVSATRHLIDACRQNKIGRLVYTSSPSVTFTVDDQSGVDESVPYPSRWLCHYPKSKAMAERDVLAAHAPPDLATCSLRPHLIWGPGDPHLLPRVVQRARSRKLRIVGDGKNLVDMVYVVNAAAAHLCAVDTLALNPDQAGGRAYFVAQDEPVALWPWIEKFCQSAGVSFSGRRVPFRVAYGLGGALEAAYRMTGRDSEPPMTRFVAAQLAKDHYFDVSAAAERLGYRPSVTMDEGLRLTADYLRELGGSS